MSGTCFSHITINLLKKPAGKLLGWGTALFGGCVEVRFNVITGAKGVFAGLPSKQGTKPDAEGKMPYYPEVKILDKEQYLSFQKAVAAEYAKITKSSGNEKAGEESQDFAEDNIPF